MSTFNILITNVSFLRSGKSNESKYEDVEHNQFTGKTTNEAPIKSVIKRLSDKGQRLDKIIYIESAQAKKEISIDDKETTTSQFLRDNIKQYTEEHHLELPISDTISIADEPKEQDVSKAVFEIYQKILNDSQNEKDGINIYFEANGGVRYVLTMLLSITKTLESSNKNIQIKEIYNMVYNREGTTPILETKQIYDTAQITSIVDEFVNYGRTRSLENYINEHLDDANPLLNKDITNLLAKLSKVADDIQLCRTGMILDDFYKDGGLRKAIDDFLKKYPGDGETVVLPVFKHILNMIQTQFGDSLYTKEQPTNSIVYLPQVIQWCLDKNFIQQALTLSTECLAEYLFETGKIQISKKMQNILDEANTQKYNKHYFFLANLQNHFLSQINNSIVRTVLEIMKKAPASLSRADLDEIINKNYCNVSCVPKPKNGKLNEVAIRVDKIGQRYIQMEPSRINKSSIKKWIKDSELDNLIDKNVKVSTYRSGTFLEVLLGKSKKKGEQVETYDQNNLNTLKKRWEKVLPDVIKEFMKPNSPVKSYDVLLDSIFSNDKELSNACKIKYSQEQSKKYYIEEAAEMGYISTNLSSIDDLQKLLYIYSICKEQRNLSNHAHVNEKDVVMNSEQLRIVIRALLKASYIGGK